MNEIINKDSEAIKAFMSAGESILGAIETILEDYHPVLGGKRFITDSQLSKILHISKRTLQDYRSQGKIPFHKLEGGKILYTEEDIEKMLASAYCKAWG